jgi:hypothetical protein
LAFIWGNSDSELSQEINAQNETCHCSLQEFGCKQLALKLNSFGNETSRGDWLAKYLSFVNSVVRKMRPAFAGNAWLWQWHVLNLSPNR